MDDCEFGATGQLYLAARAQNRLLYPQPTSSLYRLRGIALLRRRQPTSGKAPHPQLLHDVGHAVAVVGVTVAHDESVESAYAPVREVGENDFACDRPVRGWTGDAAARVEHDVMPRRIADKSAVPLPDCQHRHAQIARRCQRESGHKDRHATESESSHHRPFPSLSLLRNWRRYLAVEYPPDDRRGQVPGHYRRKRHVKTGHGRPGHGGKALHDPERQEEQCPGDGTRNHRQRQPY